MGVHKTCANKENIQRNAFNLQLFLIQCPFLFRGCCRQPLYCFHLDFRCVTLVRYIYIYIYIYNIDLKKSLIIENLYNSNREV